MITNVASGIKYTKIRLGFFGHSQLNCPWQSHWRINECLPGMKQNGVKHVAKQDLLPVGKQI